MRQHRWTGKQTGLLRRLARDGVPVRAMAVRLGVTPGQVYGEMARKNISLEGQVRVTDLYRKMRKVKSEHAHTSPTPGWHNAVE